MVDKPLQVYKDEQAEIEGILKRQDETISRFKWYFYPIVGILAVVNGAILVGMYYQEKQGRKDMAMVERIGKMRDMARSQRGEANQLGFIKQ